MLRVTHQILAEGDAVVAVHLAAVDRVQTGREGVAEVVREHGRSLGQRDDGSVFEPARPAVRDRAAFGGPLGSRVGSEVVIEGPVLFHEEDHVLDRVVAVGWFRRSGRSLGRIIAGGVLSSFAAGGWPELPHQQGNEYANERSEGLSTLTHPAPAHWSDDRPRSHRDSLSGAEDATE